MQISTSQSRSLIAFVIATIYAIPLAFGQATHMYWTADPGAGAGVVQRVEIGQSSPQTLASGFNRPRGVAVDTVNNKVYWNNFTDNTILRADLDGSNSETLLTSGDGISGPRGIAVDTTNGKIYWANSGTQQIMRANLDGSSNETLLTVSGSRLPAGITVDPSGGKVYWDTRVDLAVQRANLDGSSPEDLFTTGVGSAAAGIALDIAGGKIFWASRNGGNIQTGNMDGTGSVSNVITGLSAPIGVAIDASTSKLYWAERDAGTIKRSDFDGSNVETLISSLSSPRYLGLGPIPEPSTYALIVSTLALITAIGLRKYRQRAQGSN